MVTKMVTKLLLDVNFGDFCIADFVIPAFARDYRGRWWRRGGKNPLLMPNS
tara:strand:+ start:336 stop:488 length:153 start_codon:yes stop_codon:yes gene_type:complete